MLINEVTLSDMVQQQMIRLLNSVSLTGSRNLSEVEKDLVQMNVLLDEAIRKLGSSFMAMHEAIGRQDKLIEALVAGKSGIEDSAPGIQSVRNEIGGHINDAIVGMQFQDMTSQLIGGMKKHLAEMREVCDALKGVETDMPPDAGHGEILVVLDVANHRISELDAAGMAERKKPVDQRHMESGSIDLF